jgi:hypothetical protein
MYENNKSLSFCTSAFGKKYNLMAKLLVGDLEKFAPNHLFVIYTDIPALFKDSLNVLAVRHSCRGVLPYHERRFAIFHALKIADSTIYLDSDVRICSPLPENLNFSPGLTARSCGNFQKHMKSQFERKSNSPKLRKTKYFIDKMAQRAGVDMNSPDLKFINEFLFAVTKQEGRELDFLELWGDLAIYADTLGLHKHPTYAMALAAAKSNFSVHRSEMPGLDFFDDRIEHEKIKKGESHKDAKAEYFRQQENIEKVKKGVLSKFLRLISNKFKLFYNRTRVKLMFKLLPSKLIDYSS